MSDFRYTIEQRVFFVINFAQTHNLAEVKRRYKTQFKTKDEPSNESIKRAWDNFNSIGSVQNNLCGNVGAKKTVITKEAIAKVEKHFKDNPRNSIRVASSVLNLSFYAVQRILSKILCLHPYKISVVQPLSDEARQARVEFAKTCLDLMDQNKLDYEKIWFSDECHFWLNGFVNRQNYRIWGSENPYVTLESPLHPKKVTVWMAICGKKATPAYIFESNVTSVSYRQLLETEFFPWIRSHHLAGSYVFQQDGARPHRTFEVFEVIKKQFGQRVIALDYNKHFTGGLSWPPYSPDLNPCDFYLWGYLKDQVYKSKPKDVPELKKAITEAAKNINQEVLKSVMANLKKRCQYVLVRCGSHFENIIM